MYDFNQVNIISEAVYIYYAWTELHGPSCMDGPSEPYLPDRGVPGRLQQLYQLARWPRPDCNSVAPSIIHMLYVPVTLKTGARQMKIKIIIRLIIIPHIVHIYTYGMNTNKSRSSRRYWQAGSWGRRHLPCYWVALEKAQGKPKGKQGFPRVSLPPKRVSLGFSWEVLR